MDEVKPEEKQEAKDKGIKDLLKEIKAKQDELSATKKDKPWKLPWKGRVSNSKARDNYATFCVVKDNLEIDFIKTQISDGTADIDGIPRIATADHVMHYKGKPFYIIPYWSLKPFSPVQNYEESVKEKMNIAGRRLILSKLEKEAIKPKKKGFGGIGMWIIIGIIVLAGAYYMLKGGKLF